MLVSPQRARRPWQGRVERSVVEKRPAHDPSCYLCPGAARAGGVRNPDYDSVFVFDNDFAALLPDAAPERFERGALLRAETERGLCRVICFSPRHDLTPARMSPADLRPVVDAWAAESRSLGGRREFSYVQIFENRGEMMGCSNPHPHGQIWASASVPEEPAKETAAQRAYFEREGRDLLGDYLAIESESGERLVVENDSFAVVVPFWALWPFETLIVAKRAVAAIEDLDDAERNDLAAIYQRLTARYDNLFETSFPYSMGVHHRPHDGEDHPEWRLHLHFYPPLLRSASVRKFMVGYEMLATPQRDITPEAAAERLRALPERHYLEGSAL